MARRENKDALASNNVSPDTVVGISELYLKHGVFIDVVRNKMGEFIARVYWYGRAAEVYDIFPRSSVWSALLLAESFVYDELLEKAE